MVKIKAEIRMIVEADSWSAIVKFLEYNKKLNAHRFPPEGSGKTGGAMDNLVVTSAMAKMIKEGQDGRS